MLVVRNQRTKRARSDLLREDTRRGTIAEEDFVRDQVVRCALGFDLLGRLADHQRLGLCEIVAGEHFLVLVVLDRVVGFGGEDEVRGDEFGALVEELEEGMLGIGARFTKKNGSCRLKSVYQ